MRYARSYQNHYDDSDIDLTPMLDVVFIMLIFFIVTASFVKEYGVAFNKDNDNDAPPPKAPIVISLNSQGQVWVDDIPASMRTVKQHVERLHAQRPDSSVVIKADRNTKALWLVAAVDQSRQAGVYNVSLAKFGL